MPASRNKGHAAIFLFAREQLLFRYPVDNPFEIDVNGHTTGSKQQQQHQSSAVPSSSAHGQTARTSAVAEGATASSTAEGVSTERTALHASSAGVGLGSRHKKKKQQQQDAMNSSTADPPGNSHAHSGGQLRRPASSTQLENNASITTIGSNSNLHAAHQSAGGSSASSQPRLSISTSMSSVDVSRLHQQQQRGVGTSGGGGAAPSSPPPTQTCVGIPTNALLHLLRASLTACTTINVATGTLMIFPLLSTARAGGDDGALPGGATGSDSDMSSQRRKSQSDDKRRSRVATVMLVIAMSRPDTDSGTVSRFVQVFINALLREERRAQYVSKQVDLMDAVTAQRECFSSPSAKKERDEEDVLNTIASATDGSNSKRHLAAAGVRDTTSTVKNGAKDVFLILADDPRISLCSELVQVSKAINAWFLVQARKQEGGASIIPTTPAGGGDDATMPEGILINRLVYLPLTYLTGIANRTHQLSSVYARLSPCCVVSLRDPIFHETLQREYVDSIGKRYAKLLPLSTVHLCLTSLAHPWRIGAFYRSLERTLIEAYQQRYAANTNTRGVASPSLLPQSPQPGSGSTFNVEPQNFQSALHQQMYSDQREALKQQQQQLSNAVHHAAGLDFLAVEVIEFLRLQEAITVDSEVSVSFTHGDVMPHQAVDKSIRRVVRQQEKADQKRRSIFSESGSQGRAAAPISAKHKNASAGAGGAVPSTWVLSMLQAMKSGKPLQKRHHNHLANAAPDSAAITPSPSTVHTTSNFPSPPMSHADPFAGKYPAFRAGTRSQATTTPSVTSNSPLISMKRTTGPDTRVPSHGGHDDGRLARRHWAVYCAWGASCPLCEELASSPSYWQIAAKSQSPVSVPLVFPFLDPSVQTCAQYAGRFWENGSAADDDEGGSPQLQSAPNYTMRPWFLKPEIFLSAVPLHGSSSLNIFKQLIRGQSTTNYHHDGADSSRTDVTTLSDKNTHSNYSDSSKRSRMKYNRSQSSPYIRPEEEEGGVLLVADTIPTGAVEWLRQFAPIVDDRLKWSVKRGREIEEQIASEQAASPSLISPLDFSRPHSSHSKRALERERDASSSSQSQAAATQATAAPASSVPTNSLSRSMRYSKRQLTDRSALSSLRHLGQSASLLAAATEAAVPPPSAVISSGSGVHAGGNGEVHVVQLLGAEQYIPVELLVQFVVHHIVALTWGVEGVELEVLTRQLEHNLRRLKPFLANLTYVRQLHEAGMTSRKLLSAVQHQRKSSVLFIHTKQPRPHHTQKHSPEHISSSSRSCSTTHPLCNQDGSASLQSSESPAWGRAPPSPMDSAAQHMPPLPAAVQVVNTVTHLDIQLMQAYEVYEALGLLPYLFRYAGYPLEVIETRLLLHAAVNEFSDVLLLGGPTRTLSAHVPVSGNPPSSAL